MKRFKTTNPELTELIRSLKKTSRNNEAAVWRYIADRLESTRRGRIAVNLSRLNRHTKEGETVAVPGKVLGAGKIDHAISIAAFVFSDQASSKILGAGGKCLSITDLMKKNPKGTNVRVIG